MGPLFEPTLEQSSNNRRRSGSLLRVEDLHVVFPTSRGVAKAVNGISFEVNRGEIVGLVGESGSGKSVTSLSIMGLVPSPGRIVAHRMIFGDLDLSGGSVLRRVRGRDIAMIFQDPSNHLDPMLRVGEGLSRAISLHREIGRPEAEMEAKNLLSSLQIPSPHRVMSAYPFQLSGGLNQRVMIAMALAGNPQLLIADECTSSLDVTVQAGILALLDRLRAERGMSILLTTHNMNVVRRLADRTIVMYAGRIMESGTTSTVLDKPLHPYTRGLIAALPLSRGPRDSEVSGIAGEAPSPLDLPTGCPFHSRCPIARPDCSTSATPMRELRPGHWTSCNYAEELLEQNDD